MNTKNNTEKPFTRKEGQSSGIILSWNRNLGNENPIIASSRQGELEDECLVNLAEPADELLWDHSGDLDSSHLDNTSPVTDQNLEAAFSSSQWSTAINRINSSLILSPRFRLYGTSESIREEEIIDTEQPGVDGVGLVTIMDEEAYAKRAAEFKKLFRDVEDSILDFTEEDVFDQNIDTCDDSLNQIKNKFLTLRSSLREFYEEFDSNAHPQREQEWEDKLNALTTKYKKNERDVKAKIQQLKREATQALTNNADNTTANGLSRHNSGGDGLTDTALVAKSEIERLDILSCLNELHSQIEAVGVCAELEDFEVVKYLKLASSWKTELKVLDKRYVELQKSVVLHPFSPEIKQELHNLHKQVKDELSVVVTELENEDSTRRLYTYSKTNSRDPVPYPLFRAKDDEDVHKFIKEFKEALVRNQVALKDQTKILRTYLKNFALEVVHKDVTNIDVAYKLLLKHFGNSEKIWAAKFKIFLDECEKRWPSSEQNPKERFQKLSKLISQLEELEELITSGSVDKSELYNASSIKKLFSIIPKEVANKVFDRIDDDSTNEDKVNEIKTVMIKFRNTAQQRMLMDITTDKEPSKEKFNYGEQKNLCFFCRESWDSSTHIKEWGVFGCSELLKLSYDERRSSLVKKKFCLTCGYPRVSKSNKDPRSHRCKSIHSDLQCDGDYNGGPCKLNALTCKHKKLKSTVKPKIKSKLNLDLQGFNVVIIEEVLPISQSLPAHVNVDIDSRIEDLQLGEVAKNMDNSEIKSFFRKRESLAGNDVDKVLGIPEGETLFIFCVIKGKTRSLRAFMDCGCSSWLVKNGIPENELKSVKLRDGPIPMFVAGGHTVHATAEWASMLPLSNGMNQIIRGLSVDDVTGPFADIDMTTVIEELKESAMQSNSPLKKMIANLKAPKCVSGQTDMLIGMKHWNLFPEPLFSTPTGLTLFKNKFLSNGGGELTCIGGPSKALAKIMEQFGTCQILNMFTKMSENPASFSYSLEYFPSCKGDLEDSKRSSDEILDAVIVNDSVLSEVDSNTYKVLDVSCTCCPIRCLKSESFHSVSSDGRRYLDIQDLGLKMEYRCPSCRNCLNCRRGENYEKVSIRQEAEQCLIRESIWIDSESGQAIAKLPFRVNPLEALTNNRWVSVKMLDRVCFKYFKDKEVVDLIMKAFNKLHANGHIKYLHELSESEIAILEQAPVSYYIPWDIAFSGSISTPARPTFNGSKNTPGGTNLNDTIAKGIPNLVNLLHMTLGWIAGPEAISGDTSQFYNAVKLHPDHLPYQRFLLRDGLNPDSKLLELVICTLIYGISSVSAQTEELIVLIADKIQEDKPDVANFLRKHRYVDDFAKAVSSYGEGCSIINGVDDVFSKHKLKVKGWAQSGQKPPDNITKDGKTVTFAGMAWQPELDVYSLNHPPLHFAQKIRGRLPNDLKVFDSSNGKMAEFVPQKLSRRMITSKLMSRFDLMGKEAPLTLKFKFDLRNLIKVNPDWDLPVDDSTRKLWIDNFQMMENTRNFWFARSPVPMDAVDCKKMIVWIKSDAAERGGIMVGAWSSYERRDGSFSCSHLFGRGLLCSESLSTPKLELHGLSSAANVKVMIENAINEWVQVIHVGTDSEISLSWVLYENNKLDVFTRNRSNNIRSKVPLESLHWVEGRENLSDTGTRPENVTEKTISPDSEWILGKTWMQKSYDEALASGVIKKASDVQLSHESKKKMKEGLLIEEDYERRVHGFLVRASQNHADKIAECELSSNYIYPPLKYSFRRYVRTVACIHLAVKKFKLLALRAKLKRGLNINSELKTLNDRPIRFQYFSVTESSDKKKNLKTSFNVVGFVTKPLETNQILVNNQRKYFCLSEGDLSAALEYLFKIGTEEVYRYTDRKKIDRVAVNRQAILFFKGRIMDEQSLRAIGDLEDIINMQDFTGFNFNVPVLYRHSPLSVLIANHLHYDVLEHKGLETCYRLSLNYIHILQGRTVFRSIIDDCVKCKILHKKYLEVEMGHLHESQVTISPVFYCTMVDLFGPLTCYCPGYERATRGNSKAYKVWMMVMCCISTGTINVQVIEKEDVGGVMSGFNRFFVECSVPRMMFPDQGSQLVKAMLEMEGNILDLKHQLSSERGVMFKTCLPQSHSQHGRVERVIRSLKESLEASDVYNQRLTATGWQTVAKGIESSYNNLPLGCYYRRSLENVSILKILTPNLLRGKVSTRAPSGLFEVPENPNTMMDKVYRLFSAWYQLWNTLYVPQILERQKWFDNSIDLKEEDIVLFKLRESDMSVEWVLGKVETVRKGRDGLGRECVILYKSIGSSDRMMTVERPVREVVKLFNVEDTSLFQDIEKARSLAEFIIKEEEFNCGETGSHGYQGTVDTCSLVGKSVWFPDMYVEQIKKMNDEEVFKSIMLETSSSFNGVNCLRSYCNVFSKGVTDSQADVTGTSYFSYEDVLGVGGVSTYYDEEDKMIFI